MIYQRRKSKCEKLVVLYVDGIERNMTYVISFKKKEQWNVSCNDRSCTVYCMLTVVFLIRLIC